MMPGLPVIAIGSKFGERVVIDGPRFVYRGQKQYLCECSCGDQTWVLGRNLSHGKQTKCARCSNYRHGNSTGQQTPEYRAWRNMLNRCNNPKCDKFRFYGGRGISVSPKWMGKSGFINFLSDVGPRPNDKQQLDRIDTYGNYEPGNVRWVTCQENLCNRRNSINVTHQGVTRNVSEWAREFEVCNFMLRRRIKAGMSIEQAVAELTNSK